MSTCSSKSCCTKTKNLDDAFEGKRPSVMSAEYVMLSFASSGASAAAAAADADDFGDFP